MNFSQSFTTRTHFETRCVWSRSESPSCRATSLSSKTVNLFESCLRPENLLLVFSLIAGIVVDMLGPSGNLSAECFHKTVLLRFIHNSVTLYVRDTPSFHVRTQNLINAAENYISCSNFERRAPRSRTSQRTRQPLPECASSSRTGCHMTTIVCCNASLDFECRVCAVCSV